MICRNAIVILPDANFLSSWCQSPSSRAQNRHFCAFFASETLIFGHFEHKIGVLVLFWPSEPSFSGFLSTKSRFLSSGGRLSFGEWWVLSCILTFVVCLSNFYELFLLKLLLRVCRSILAVALLPKLCCRSVAAVTLLQLSSYRGAAAGMLSPPAECFATTGGTPPAECFATTGGTPPPPPPGIGLL